MINFWMNPKIYTPYNGMSIICITNDDRLEYIENYNSNMGISIDWWIPSPPKRGENYGKTYYE